MIPAKYIAVLYFYAIWFWNIDDHQRNPNNNERAHIVGQLTNVGVS